MDDFLSEMDGRLAVYEGLSGVNGAFLSEMDDFLSVIEGLLSE